mgnify:CR=1 FL=1
MMGGMSRSPRDARVAGFLAAEALSAIGSWASLIAIWGYAAFEFDADVGDISLFGIAFALPGIVLGPFAGSVIVIALATRSPARTSNTRMASLACPGLGSSLRAVYRAVTLCA